MVNHELHEVRETPGGFVPFVEFVVPKGGAT